MYIRKSITAGELIQELQKAIGELSLLDEDEPVLADCWIGDNKQLINDLMYDREHEWPEEMKDEEIRELLSYIHPKDIHDYFIDSEDAAKEYETYYDMLTDARHISWHNKLKVQIPEELLEKYGL